MKLKVGLAQISPKLGDLEANLECHLQAIEKAAKSGVELLIFPELSLTGYQLRDLVYSLAIQPTRKNPIFARLLDASQNIDLVVSFVEVDTRQRFFISAAYLSAGEVVHLHRKLYLPTYGMFDEGRYFARGDQLRAFNTRFGRVGILICEDFWHVSAAHTLWLDGADILIFISASIGSGLGAEQKNGLATEQKIGSARRVDHINRAYAFMFTNFVMHTNRIGSEDGATFFGGSTIFGPEGTLLAQGPYFEEAIVTARLDLNEIRRARIRLPLLRDERVGLTRRELSRILDQ